MTEISEIKKKSKEIKDLKKKLEKKEKVFNLIRENKKDKAKKILEKDRECLSYFIKFKHPSGETGHQDGKIISLYIGGWDIHYNHYHENDVIEDLERLRKEIEEKENRLEQKLYLKEQQEYLKEQKKDIGEGSKDRKKLQDFTFVLAFGVIATLIFNWFQIFVEFQYAQKSHAMIIGGIFIVLFTMIIMFLVYVMGIGKKIKSFVFDWRFIFSVILALILIGILILFLFSTPNKSINQDNSELTFLNESFQELKEIRKNQTIILNSILKEQVKINEKIMGG